MGTNNWVSFLVKDLPKPKTAQVKSWPKKQSILAKAKSSKSINQASLISCTFIKGAKINENYANRERRLDVRIISFGD